MTSHDVNGPKMFLRRTGDELKDKAGLRLNKKLDREDMLMTIS